MSPQISDLMGRTMSSTPYTFPSRDGNFTQLASTNSSRNLIASHLSATKKSLDLIQQLSAQRGVGLLLFCMRGQTRRDYTEQLQAVLQSIV
ncbi:hypothetical protein PAXRUDRAFT_767885 [Paxillus rubicundulus Ve08.2h10]|uniref:Uncharacterized protein n=1 Tax=Paxillus rubicundulus Ve08.2h10 TaxID=930991 RepID=A0A0D0DGG1_9AGAM|nr:hypothetical protein PAXRUDRAFT_767885 [Paxillus rubicundulus Ve08.2h10]